IGLWKS
nr:Chain C, ILE-GLY-LEU-TRP-LYS peptide [synthetic construct]6WZX_D Chain D, ILE-GLY-LEU-TRP-LYS peptide [synthetic construct]